MAEPKAVFPTDPNNPHILNATSVFGTFAKDSHGNIVTDDSGKVDASQGRYTPDLMHEWQVSDHPPLLVTVNDGDGNGNAQDMHGLCWNIMKQCNYNTQHNNYNNAFYKQENHQQYLRRLNCLADLIIQMYNENNLAFLSLQEAPPFQGDSNQDYRQAFYDKIRQATGLEYIPDSQVAGQGLVTLYDPKQLMPNKKTVNGQTVSNSGFARENHNNNSLPRRIQEVKFTSNTTKKEYQINNGHGQFTDAIQVAQYLKSQQTDPHKNTINCFDTNILTNQQARDNAKNNLGSNTTQHIDHHEQAVNDLNDLQGGYAAIQGTTDYSKDGKDTFDFVGMSDHIKSNQSVYKPLGDYDFDIQQTIETRKQHEATISENVKQKLKRLTQPDTHKPNPRAAPKSNPNSATSPNKNGLRSHIDWSALMNYLEKHLSEDELPSPDDQPNMQLQKVTVYPKQESDTTDKARSPQTYTNTNSDLNQCTYSPSEIDHLKLQYADKHQQQHTIQIQNKKQHTDFDLGNNDTQEIDKTLDMIQASYKSNTPANKRTVNIEGIDCTASHMFLSDFPQANPISASDNACISWQEYAYLKASSLNLKPTGHLNISVAVKDLAKKLHNNDDVEEQPESSAPPHSIIQFQP